MGMENVAMGDTTFKVDVLLDFVFTKIYYGFYEA
jgi:hypothetical protein